MARERIPSSARPPLRAILSLGALALLALAAAAPVPAARAQTAANVNSSNLLMPFIGLLSAPGFEAANLGEAIAINNGSTAAERSQAVSDNTFTLNNASAIADGLGTKLDQIYQNAINSGSPVFAADSALVQLFTQANAVATADASYDKLFFSGATLAATGSTTDDLRPFQVAPNQIQAFAPSILSPLTDNPTFPSGHATFAYTSALLLAIMVPERYQQLLTRASEFGNSRIVLGAHDALDVIGGRILATYDVVQLLTDNPAYLSQSTSELGGGTLTTSSDFSALFGSATSDLRGLLQQGCGTDIASCAASGAPDRFSDSQQNLSDYTFRLTYGLPFVGPTDLPPVVPPGAEVLLATRFPYLTTAQLRDVLATTELPSGVPLDNGTGWARLDLYAAAGGYGAFDSDVAVTMNASLGGFNALDSWSNNIDGPGGLTLNGTGTLVLTGTDTYSGNTVVNGGTLVVNGSIASSTLVGPGGTLSGTGTIAAPLVNNGTLAPGYPSGTLNVSGNYTQTAAGSLKIEVSPSGASSLAVGGSATLAGSLSLVFAPGSYGPKRYTILEANNISGAFTSVSGTVPTAGLSQAVTVDPTSVTLALTSGPQSAPTSTLVAPTNDAFFPAMTTTMVEGSQRATQMVLDRPGTRIGAEGEETTAQALAPPPGRMQLALLGGGSGNLAALGEAAAALPRIAAQYGAWFRGTGSFASVNGNAAAPGFDAESGGFMVGLDRPVTGNAFAGLAAGFEHSDVRDRSTSNGSIDTARGMVYGGGALGPSEWSAAAGYAHDAISTERGLPGIGTASESHGGSELDLGGQGSLPLALRGITGAMTLTPKVGLRTLLLSEASFSETGAGGFDLSSRGRASASVQPFLGITASETFVTDAGARIAPELRLAYAHEAADDDRTLTVSTVGGTDFLVQGLKPSRDMLSAGAALTLRTAESVFLSASYDAVLRTGNTSVQSVSAGLHIRF